MTIIDFLYKGVTYFSVFCYIHVLYVFCYYLSWNLFVLLLYFWLLENRILVPMMNMSYPS